MLSIAGRLRFFEACWRTSVMRLPRCFGEFKVSRVADRARRAVGRSSWRPAAAPGLCGYPRKFHAGAGSLRKADQNRPHVFAARVGRLIRTPAPTKSPATRLWPICIRKKTGLLLATRPWRNSDGNRPGGLQKPSGSCSGRRITHQCRTGIGAARTDKSIFT